MSDLAATAIAAARAGGDIVRAAIERGGWAVRRKAPSDFVTDVDVAAERAIVQVIQGAFPAHGVLGEEGGRLAEASADGHVWVIDPLDGTTNFIRAIPYYAVAVSVERHGVPVACAVLDLPRDVMFHAARGEGAWEGSTRLAVSPEPDLAAGLVLTGIPFRALGFLPRYVPGLERVARASAGIRRMGSAALDLCLVASGRAEAFWEFGLARWDVSAGGLLVEEAGGRVTDLEGGSAWLESGDLLASNGLVHEAMLRCV